MITAVKKEIPGRSDNRCIKVRAMGTEYLSAAIQIESFAPLHLAEGITNTLLYDTDQALRDIDDFQQQTVINALVPVLKKMNRMLWEMQSELPYFVASFFSCCAVDNFTGRGYLMYLTESPILAHTKSGWLQVDNGTTQDDRINWIARNGLGVNEHCKPKMLSIDVDECGIVLLSSGFARQPDDTWFQVLNTAPNNDTRIRLLENALRGEAREAIILISKA